MLSHPYILMLGTIEPRKNHLRLLQAWKQLPQPRPFLVIVGRPGWECEPIVAEIEAAVQRRQARWHRACDDARVFRYMAHATALAYPSRLEGFGFPPLEAAALGTPVLAGDTPALREVMQDAACFCDPEDTDAVAEALARLVEDEELRRRLVARGLERVKRFTWQECAHRHATVYREAMEVMAS